MNRSPEQQSAQRPDLAVEEVVGPARKYELSYEAFSWIDKGGITLPLIEVVLVDCKRSVHYGSAVSGNATLARIADKVSERNSIACEQSMFRALPAILENRTAPSINAVNSIAADAPVFKTTKRGKNVPRIFFTVLEADSDRPTVVKLAVADHKKQQQVLGVMGNGAARRKKRD